MPKGFSDKVRQQIYDAAGGACAMCYRVRPFEQHHVVPRGMGGSQGISSRRANAKENGILLCHICHDATHLIHSIDADGFCCDICPAEWACQFSQAKARKDTGLPVMVAEDQGYRTSDQQADDQIKRWG